jgi:hypothetical protein
MKSPCHHRLVRFAMAVSALGCDGLHYLKIWQYYPQSLAAAGLVTAFVARFADVHVIALSGTCTPGAEVTLQLFYCDGYLLIQFGQQIYPPSLLLQLLSRVCHVYSFLKKFFLLIVPVVLQSQLHLALLPHRNSAVSPPRYCSLPGHVYGLLLGLLLAFLWLLLVPVAMQTQVSRPVLGAALCLVMSKGYIAGFYRCYRGSWFGPC